MAGDILQDRSQKYGRNVTVSAGIILVLAWVPGIEIDKFKPLGFDVGTAPGAELSFWWLLLGILSYYFVRFLINLRIDYLVYRQDKSHIFQTRNNQKNRLKIAIEEKNEQRIATHKRTILNTRAEHINIWQFYIFDTGLAVGLSSAAAYAAIMAIVAAWPSDPG